MIRKIQLSRLRNEEHLGFHAEFEKLANGYELSEAFVALREVYNQCYDELEATTEIIRKSDYTRRLEEADRERIHTYRRLRSGVRGFLRTSEPEKRLAANHAHVVIHQYGNLDRTSRDKRTYGLASLLGDLREKAAPDLQKLGVTGWVSELEANVQTYKTLKESRRAQKEDWTPVKRVKAARAGIDAAYQKIVHQLEAQGALTPADENLVSMVFNLNDILDLYNRLIAQRYGIMAAQREREIETGVGSSSSVAV